MERCQQEIVETYAANPIPQRARADEELHSRLLGKRNSEPCSVCQIGRVPGGFEFDCAGNIGWAGGQNLDWFLVSLAVSNI